MMETVFTLLLFANLLLLAGLYACAICEHKKVKILRESITRDRLHAVQVIEERDATIRTLSGRLVEEIERNYAERQRQASQRRVTVTVKAPQPFWLN